MLDALIYYKIATFDVTRAKQKTSKAIESQKPPTSEDEFDNGVYRFSSDRLVEYEDSDEKLVNLSKEIIKFHVSPEEIKCLRLTCDLHCSETDYLYVNEMILLTTNLDDYHDIEPGDIIWDKLTVGLFFFLDDITGFEITYLLEVGLKLLLFPLGSSIVLKKACCSVGVILPVYSTFKAIETNNITGQQKMLLY
nr:HVA22-like protein K [Tanacetum cinerariifolium]